MLTNRRHALTLFCAAVFATGCRKGAAPLRLADAEYITVETLTRLLLGDPPREQDLHPETAEKPLLKEGVYDKVVIAADADSFARVSRGAISAKDLRELETRVVSDVDKKLKKRGFSASGATFPPPAQTEARTLLATITPVIEEAGSPTDRAHRRNDALVLIRLTVTDGQTGIVIARRDFYSGTDVRRPNNRPSPAPANP